MVFSHGAINTVAASLFKIATTSGCWVRARVRDWASWRCPRMSRALHHAGQGQSHPMRGHDQVCVQIFGNNAALTFADSQGHFELNVYNPVMAYNFLQSVRLMADSAVSFTDNCVVGSNRAATISRRT